MIVCLILDAWLPLAAPLLFHSWKLVLLLPLPTPWMDTSGIPSIRIWWIANEKLGFGW